MAAADELRPTVSSSLDYAADQLLLGLATANRSARFEGWAERPFSFLRETSGRPASGFVAWRGRLRFPPDIVGPAVGAGTPGALKFYRNGWEFSHRFRSRYASDMDGQRRVTVSGCLRLGKRTVAKRFCRRHAHMPRHRLAASATLCNARRRDRRARGTMVDAIMHQGRSFENARPARAGYSLPWKIARMQPPEVLGADGLFRVLTDYASSTSGAVARHHRACLCPGGR